MDLEKIKEKKSVKELLEFSILNIDKSSGPTSFNVSDFVRKKLGLKKTSHFGTLDPKVTGVLPIALNRACKLTGYFLGEDKEYVGIMRMHKDISLAEIKKVIKKKFLGKIKQTPPVKSRVKRQEREREIKSFELLEKNGQDIIFRTEVQGGTYIRKLIDDLGKELGVGAHMLELRRTRAGIFEEKESITLYELKEIIKDEKKLKKVLIPGEIISKLHPVVQVKKEILGKLFNGSPIHKKDLEKKNKLAKDKVVSVFCKEKFVGIYKTIQSETIFAKPEFVFQPLRRN